MDGNNGPPAEEASLKQEELPPAIDGDATKYADNVDLVAVTTSLEKAGNDNLDSDVEADVEDDVAASNPVDGADSDGPLPEDFDVDPDDLLLCVMTHKEDGNAQFNSGDYTAAARSYRKGTKLLKKIVASGDEQVKQLLITLQTNLSMVCYRQKKHKMSHDVASKALEVDGRNVKALYRRAVASRAMGDFDAARLDLREALKVDPNNVVVKKELVGIKKQADDAKAKEKARLQKAFSSSGSMLYSDREEEEKRRAEKKKEEERLKEEDLKRHKSEWENECVRRMSSNPPEEATSFEDWDKRRKQKEEVVAKARKKEEEDKRRMEREVRKKVNKEDKDNDSDDESELTEKELAMLRGYKKTSDGRTTSYFSREQSEEEKKLIGCIKPKRLDQSPSLLGTVGSTALDSGVGSAWNQAGTTWEERDTTDWCKGKLERCLLDTTSAYYSTTTDDATYVAVVRKVKDLTGDASVAISGGKKRYIYDFHVSVEFEILDEGEDPVASGMLRLPDVNSATTAHEEEFEVDLSAWKKLPLAGKDNTHVVLNAVKCRNILVQDIRKSVLQFVEEFNKSF